MEWKKIPDFFIFPYFKGIPLRSRRDFGGGADLNSVTWHQLSFIISVVQSHIHWLEEWQQNKFQLRFSRLPSLLGRGYSTGPTFKSTNPIGLSSPILVASVNRVISTSWVISSSIHYLLFVPCWFQNIVEINDKVCPHIDDEYPCNHPPYFGLNSLTFTKNLFKYLKEEIYDIYLNLLCGTLSLMAVLW